ncbi:MAG: S8 family serine peptidase, partial [Bdellovibrionales bacterium]|nr:S8 family serine peptidase [Bdellovibrionales bacterium]
YEIFNLDASTLRSEWPEAQVVRNRFFKTFENKHLPSIEERMMMLAETVNTGGEKLEQCVEDLKSPTPEIEVTQSSEDISDQIMDLGGDFSLSSGKSKAHPDHPSDLKVGWLVMAPQGSKKGREIFFAQSIKYQPDAYGMYSILMVVQDSRKVCAGASFELIVTGNKEFVGNDVNVDDILKQFDRKTFAHLPEVHADEAQVEATGEGVLVAIIDTGVNYNHAALVKNVWTNKKEIPGNKIDDDGNGQIDDITGYDFVNDDGSPYDDQGHGSHVAGLTASSFFGLAPKAKFMAIKGLGPAGGDIASIVGGIYYAVDNGAKVLNMSFGNYGPPHPAMVQVMDYAEAKDVVV